MLLRGPLTSPMMVLLLARGANSAPAATVSLLPCRMLLRLSPVLLTLCATGAVAKPTVSKNV